MWGSTLKTVENVLSQEAASFELDHRGDSGALPGCPSVPGGKSATGPSCPRAALAAMSYVPVALSHREMSFGSSGGVNYLSFCLLLPVHLSILPSISHLTDIYEDPNLGSDRVGSLRDPE